MNGIKRKVISYFIALLMILTTMPTSLFAASSGGAITTELRMSILSDTHLYSSTLGTTGNAFNNYINNDRKMIKESEQILDSALTTIQADPSDVVLITGDLTKDGEKFNHQLMAEKLQALEDAGKKVYVINGNHDISNADAYSYNGDDKTRVDTISPSDFKTIYKNFGYDEAIAQDSSSLSYVVEPIPGYRIIAIDSCVYNGDASNPHQETRGEIKASTLAWAKAQIKEARVQGKQIVGMMHHGLVPHVSIQPTMFSEYLISGFKDISNQLVDSGLAVIFTGHFHSQDISVAVSPAGNKIYDIETGSTVTYPVPIRNVVLSGNTLQVTSQKVGTVSGISNFDTYANDFLIQGLKQQVPGMLAGALHKDLATANYLAQTEITTGTTLDVFLSNCMAKHYVGDETLGAYAGIINYLTTTTDSTYQMLGGVAMALATDSGGDIGSPQPVADNNATITIDPVISPAAAKTITIIHTNDTHGRVFPDANNKDMIGIDKIAAFHKNTPHSILVDAGDTIHGLPIANITQGKNIIELLSLAGYDVMVPGNHDFNYGSAKLKEYAEDPGTTFDIISANIANKADGSAFLPGTTIKEVDGIKVGFFGLTTTDTETATNPVNVETLEFKNYVISAQMAIDELRANGAEVIVAVAHASRPAMKGFAHNLRNDIDVIIDAHDHVNTSETVEGILIASAGQYEESIGQVVLNFDNNGALIDKSEQRIDRYLDKDKKIENEQIKNLVPDPIVKARATEMMAAINVLFSQKVAVSDVSLSSARGDEKTKGVRNAEMPLGNLVADAMRAILKTDVAITNGGGLRANIEKGDVTKGHLNSVLPFGNFGVVKEVTPAALKEILENGLKSTPTPLGAFPQVSGMKVVYNPQATAGSRVTSITIGNKVLNLNDITTKYTLATNDFMANGGDNYTAIKVLNKLSEGDSLDVIFENYVTNVLGGKITAENAKLEGRILGVIPSSDSSSGSGSNSGTTTNTPVATTAQTEKETTVKKAQEAVQKLSSADKKEVIKKLEEYLPYTLPAGRSLTADQLQKLTNNKFTKEDLETMLKNPEILKTLGIDMTRYSTAVVLKPIENLSFRDVKASHWANESIKRAAALGLAAGLPDGSFVPSAPLKVADTFTFLDRVLLINNMTESKLPRSTVESYIKDKESWAFKSMASIGSKLSENTLKIVSGFKDQPLTREVFAQVLFELLKDKIKAVKEVPAFTDIQNSPYQEAINYCVSVGLLNGTTNQTLSPQKPLTRAELMVILIRIDELMK